MFNHGQRSVPDWIASGTVGAERSKPVDEHTQQDRGGAERPASIVADAAGRLVVRGHHEVVAVARDHDTFSSAVSRFMQIPNGLDGEAHAAARRMLDPFLAHSQVDALEPTLHEIAAGILRRLRGGVSFDAVTDLGARFAVRAQSRWLGWRADIEDLLLEWVADNRAATRSGDQSEMTRVARQFDAIIRALLDERREEPHDDLTSELLRLQHADGSVLSEEEIVSILRNWTGGDLSSIALCTGVMVHWLATHPEEQERLAGAPGESLDAAIDEMLRIDDPFVSNRRRAARDTTVGGCPVSAGTTMVLDWRSANRDARVFPEPDRFDPEANRPNNLVYGIGIHVCPGRELATRELRVVLQEVLAAGRIEFDEQRPPVREQPPVAGYRTVHVRLFPHAQSR